MFEHLIVQTFFLDARALVHGFHRPDHAATLGNPIKLGHHRLFNQICQSFDNERPLKRVFIFREAQLFIDDQLNRHRASYAVFGRCRDRLIVSIGVQGIAVVVYRVQGLERGADVIEINLLSVQRAAGSLDVVFEHLRARGCAIFLPHGLGPNAARYTPDHSIFRVNSVGKEKTEVGAKFIQIHSSA